MAVAGLALTGAFALPASARIVDEPVGHSAADAGLALTPFGTYETGIVDEGAAEIVSFDAGSRRLFVVNAAQAVVEVLDVADPAAPAKLFDLPTAGTPSGDGSTVPAKGVANSVDVRADGLGAVAVEAPDKTDAGWVVFFDARSDDGAALGAVRVGALPDMLTFTPDGAHLLVANEGEPAEDYSADPEGSVAVVAVGDEVAAPEQDAVAIADFHEFEEGGSLPLPGGVRIYGGREDAGTGTPDRPVSENLEPEYITVAGGHAYATLQEANAVAVVDIESATVMGIWSLGFKNHHGAGAGLDPSDEDGGIAIDTWPVFGMYQPDGVASYTAGGETYLVTANEGDTRDWEAYSEVARVGDLGEDGLPPVCEGMETFLGDEGLGRLNVTTATGLSPNGDCFTALYSNGARSFSIWTTDGERVFDSGQQLEEITAAAAPDFFNSNHTESNLEGRSDDKGPEPEGVVVGEVGDRTYAFIGFERVSGVAVFDITTPAEASFVTYVNNRDFSVSVEDGGAVADAGDLGPEGLEFIPADASPVPGTALLAVGNEVSGSTTLYRIDEVDDGGDGDESGGDESGGDESGGDESGGDESGGDEPGGDESGGGGGVSGGGGGVSGGDGGVSGGDGEELPDTGAGATLVALAGVLLVASGAVVVSRRPTP
ncbi:choice-of-anchor I family protein [Jiangella asiatica]|uniref:LPXTG cell wall anchor domain-containing protein n=1 Tax=Jiangella asiatica TaxID=2530372 RepID=A0A4R5CG32_9ACTN|nr:choice-of-anchor I family protein [Jiangella asiatica]TDD99061.1 LPXTG cell wall anchor domain-containing protein [Jiangella asiatica]